MNKNFKVIQIHGLSGLIIVGFLVMGLVSGFVVFPIWGILQLWNYIVTEFYTGPLINYYQSTLIWSAVLLSLYIYFKNNVPIKIQTEEKLDATEIKEIITEIKEKETTETEITKKEE